MSIFSAYILPLRRQSDVARTWPSVRVYLYATKTSPGPRRQLQTDWASVLRRTWERNHTEKNQQKYRLWYQANAIKIYETRAVWYKNNKAYHDFLSFVRTSKWAREALVWGTHQPDLTEERIKRPCASCGYHEIRGLRLWWKRKLQPDWNERPEVKEQLETDLYDCSYCFHVINPERLAPFGFEGLAPDDLVAALRKARKAMVKSYSSSSEGEKSH